MGSPIAIAIDRARPEPIHKQVADRLREAIQHGRVPAGAKLPSTRIFAGELGLSRNTVLQAFEVLTTEGFLRGRVGAGTFVQDTLSAAVTVPVPGEAEHRAGSYPFRSLSRRGNGILMSAQGEFDERPTTFMPDVPDLREFPMRTWMRLLNETSGRLAGKTPADMSSAGYEPLRRAIAEHLRAARGMSCHPAQVIITTGSQQSLDLICRIMLDPGDPVWLEDPGYMGSRAVVGANGATMYPIGVDREGLRVEEAAGRYPVPRLILTSPARQYPLGTTMSLPRRQALLRFARQSGCWIVEDDYDNEFRYEGTSLPALFGLDGDARTFHIGTFSKILIPSFRIGYLVVPSDLAAAFARARSIVDRHASPIEQMVLSEFMLRGLFASHVRRMRSLYRGRQIRLIEGLRSILAGRLCLQATETGLHLTLPMAGCPDDRGLVHAAAARGIVVRPLSPYYSGSGRQNGLLLGFAAFDRDEIDRGLTRMEALASEMMSYL